VFVDRDGTVNEEIDYLCEPDQVRLIPGAAEAIDRLRKSGWLVVVITNQSAIARGLLSEDTLATIHQRLGILLAELGTRVDGIYYCPHHPTEGSTPYKLDCECRKPKPGMILRAARELNIDIVRSIVIGDRLQDLETAARVGARRILVKTGYGAGESLGLDAQGKAAPEYIADDLLDASNWILAADGEN
jgi:D-glycero-D-manno-heptose 1,7-bisphosphate phosphatase